MDEGIFTDPNITSRINQWQQEVQSHIKNHIREGRQASLVNIGYGPNGIRLRQSARPSLKEISGNQIQRNRKRKFADVMGPKSKDVGEKDHDANKQAGGKKKGPGRPRTKPEVLSGFVQLAPKDSVSVVIPRSPGKKAHKVSSAEQDLSNEKMTIQDLRQCIPAVFETDMKDLSKIKQYVVPKPVQNLYNTLRDVPQAVIPGELSQVYHEKFKTPNKSTERIDNSAFLPRNKSRFPVPLHPMLESRVQLVFEKAKRNKRTNAIERQWGATGHLLLEAIAEMFSSLEVLNIENCSIEPYEMRPTRPNTKAKFVDLGDGQTHISRSSINQANSFAKMVDWTVALKIDSLEENLLEKAYISLADYEHCVGQNCSTHLRNSPLAIDIEVKKNNDPGDLLVQLAVWVSAGFKKKQTLGLKDFDMPMPGLLIKGHVWEWCIFLYVRGELALLGPYHMGSTASIQGIWTILTRLAILMEWANAEFRQWFRTDVLGWAKAAKKKLIADGVIPRYASDLESEMPLVGK